MFESFHMNYNEILGDGHIKTVDVEGGGEDPGHPGDRPQDTRG